MSRKITSKGLTTSLAEGFKQEFLLLNRFCRFKFSSLLRRYPEQCFALMMLLILISVTTNLIFLFHESP